MPRIASDPSKQCLGFSSTDHRRCRLERVSNEYTCKVHKNYYLNWFEKHPGFLNHSVTSREYNEYHFQIVNRHVHIPIHILKNLSEIYSDYYLFLITHTGYQGHVNMYCLDRLVQDAAQSLLYQMRIGIRISPYKYIAYLIPLFTSYEAIKNIYTMIWNHIVGYLVTNRTDIGFAKWFIRKLFGLPIWRPIVLSPEMKTTNNLIWKYYVSVFQSDHIDITESNWSKQTLSLIHI